MFTTFFLMLLFNLILHSIHKSKHFLLKNPNSGLLNITVYYLSELISSPLNSSVCYSSKFFMNVQYMPAPALGSRHRQMKWALL